MCGGANIPEVDSNYPLSGRDLQQGNLYTAKYLGPKVILMACDENRVVELGTGTLWYYEDEEFANVYDEYSIYSVNLPKKKK